MAIRPAKGSPEHAAIEATTYTMPGLSINHSDWGNFTKDPIAVSIETKRAHGDMEKSILQMGTWHSCQWRALHNLRIADQLAFLPGVIVKGHEWFFVASVLGPAKKAVLYTKQQMGTTETELGIYQIIAALSVLRDWAAGEYWPVFRTAVLNLGQ